MFSLGTSGKILCTVLKTKPPPFEKISSRYCPAGLISCNTSPGVFDITSFGIGPNQTIDATPAVIKALSQVSKNRPVTLRFPKGTYHFYKEGCNLVYIPISGTQPEKQWNHYTPFFIKHKNNLTIDGEGSLFMFHGRVTPIVIDSSINIVFRNATIEHEHPSIYEMKIVEVNAKSVVVQVHPDSRYVIKEDGSCLWLDGDGIEQKATRDVRFNPERDVIWRSGDNGLMRNGLLRVVEKEKGVLEYFYPQDIKDKFTVGHYIHLGEGTRNQQGSIIHNSKNIMFEDLNIGYWNGLGFMAQLSENITLQRLKMAPLPGSNRTTVLPIHINEITAYEQLDEYTTKVYVKNPLLLPDEFHGYAENRTRIPDSVIIRGNTFSRCPTRSILLYTSRKAVIENNTFHPQMMSSILMKTPDDPWMLQSCVEDVLIQNNTFIDCYDMQGVIRTGLQRDKMPENGKIFKGIRILNNRFINTLGKIPILNMQTTDGVLFKGNTIDNDGSQQQLRFQSCINIKIENNQWNHPDGKINIGWSESDTSELHLDSTRFQIVD